MSKNATHGDVNESQTSFFDLMVVTGARRPVSGCGGAQRSSESKASAGEVDVLTHGAVPQRAEFAAIVS